MSSERNFTYRIDHNGLVSKTYFYSENFDLNNILNKLFQNLRGISPHLLLHQFPIKKIK